MGSGVPKEEEGRLQTVYKETHVVLFSPVRIKILAREHLALHIILHLGERVERDLRREDSSVPSQFNSANSSVHPLPLS